MEGWLEKQSQNALGMWARRWFTLTDSCLYYFATKPEPEGDSTPRTLPGTRIHAHVQARTPTYARALRACAHSPHRLHVCMTTGAWQPCAWAQYLSARSHVLLGTIEWAIPQQYPLNSRSWRTLRSVSVASGR
jgi:hypothetical protein